MSTLSKAFRNFAEATARHAGRPAAFLLAALVIIVWAVTGPMFGFNDTWQLVINTGTTIVTFLMVFLIQNSQNRDSAALQIKLDELIRTSRSHNAILDVDNLDEEALERIRENYRKLAHNKEEEARQSRRAGSRARREDESDEACEEVKEIDRELAKASADHAEAEGAEAGEKDKEEKA
ncbi:low affinity iron permease family protein [Frateuria sp. STR12]|uniref:low affinity iron permease family protein n=1 Tax=Frateuria hangzhouensis TaxID=2995589 RepID=UPI002260835B|nr:low affinity iron permease family protein [Frateuria sp. STR12]MCX7514053.1 low affinity iron permease family protein [Frateuria sp. STR12]